MSAELIAALNASLDDERKAEATYVAVMDKFGPVAPFSNIIEAERKHAAMVIDLFEDRKLDVPANSWLGQGKAEETLVANCVVGITAEEENIEMYDRLIATLSPDDEDVKQVFLALQAASRDKHLPAFKQCAGVI
ncbi:MAG: DUF2202 domain-containing protein [Sphingomonadaceae bacterium]|nr:DUF2202 domain-containing protein [Sphingomonadaceae bacterium]